NGTNPASENDVTASDGNVNVTAQQATAITASTEYTSVVIGATVNSSNAVAGGGAVAVNTIIGNVEAYTQDTNVTADAGRRVAGNTVISSADSSAIVAEVVGISAAANFTPKGSNAVAIGAAVAVNLIGWSGTVADETEDTNDEVTISAAANGGSLTAGGDVAV